MGHELFPLVNYGRHRNLLIHAIYRRIVGNLDWGKLDEDLALFLKAHPEADAMILPASKRLERGGTRGSLMRRASHAFKSLRLARAG